MHLARANRHYIQDVKSNDMFVLKESYTPYNIHLDTEKALLKSGNVYYWDENVTNSRG